MSWRERFLLWFGPGFLGGVTFGNWLTLLRENHFAIDPPYLLRAASITLSSFGNSLVRKRDNAVYGDGIAETKVEPPIFLLGIWRSGTTHLQNLFAVDDRFAFPNVYQVTYPHTFLSTEAASTRMGRLLLPKKRLQDNMRFGLEQPCEDELALCITTFRSEMLSVVFPRRADHYDRYLTLRGVPEAEVAEWKDALLWFTKKVTWKYRKPLVLKSPHHTGRIRRLLEVFPDARFVHIHRNPYVVFQSARHTLIKMMDFFTLQRPPLDVEYRTIRLYLEMFDAFIEERGLIRQDRIQEVCFEDLERDPIGELRRVYKALSLPDFGVVEPSMQGYVDSLSGYKKNTYLPLDPDLKERIAQACQRCFEEWGYPV